MYDNTAKKFPESETNSDRPVSIYMKPHRAYPSICSPERRRHDAACNNMGKLSGRTASVGGGSGGHRKRCTAAGTAETTEPPRAGTGDETLYRLCGNDPAERYPRTDHTGGDDLETTGFFDYMDEDTVLAVEWSENIAEELPEDALRIDIQRIDEDSREISITAPEGDDRFEDISY